MNRPINTRGREKKEGRGEVEGVGGRLNIDLISLSQQAYTKERRRQGTYKKSKQTNTTKVAKVRNDKINERGVGRDRGREREGGRERKRERGEEGGREREREREGEKTNE